MFYSGGCIVAAGPNFEWDPVSMINRPDGVCIKHATYKKLSVPFYDIENKMID